MSPQRWKRHRTCANHHFRLEKPNWFEGLRLLESVRQNEVGKHSNFCTTLGMVKKKFFYIQSSQAHIEGGTTIAFSQKRKQRAHWGQMEYTIASAMNVTLTENVLPPDSSQGFLSGFILCAKDFGPLQRAHFNSVLYLCRFYLFN